MKYLYPVSPTTYVTQSFAQHVKRAKANGWCPGPGNCLGGIYYYGGIDYGCATGTPVKAAQSGTVTVARKDASGYGVHVRIQHGDGSLTIYGHLQNTAVKAGDKVQAGQVIGLSDNTGNSSGPHLHFELRNPAGVPIDPAPLLVTALDPEPEPTEPTPPTDPTSAVITAGWNLRAGPSTSDTRYATSLSPISATVVERRDGWVKVQIELWVIGEAVDG